MKGFFPSLITICKMAWDLDESAFVAFWEVTLKLLPYYIRSRNSSAEHMYFSSIPITLILLFLSSIIFNSVRLFSKSYSFPQYISKKETKTCKFWKFGCIDFNVHDLNSGRFIELQGSTIQELPSQYRLSWCRSCQIQFGHMQNMKL